MNRTKSIKKLFSVACACLALAACATNQSGTSSASASGTGAASNSSSARLIVHRSPTFGGGFLTLTLDGTQVANVGLNRTYDAYVSPGQRVLTAVPYTEHFGSDPGFGHVYGGSRQDVFVHRSMAGQ